MALQNSYIDILAFLSQNVTVSEDGVFKERVKSKQDH